MKSSIRFALSAAVACTVAIRLQAFETVDIGLAVVDDRGKPVADATVGMGVSDSHGQKAAGVTDSNGMFSARLKMMGSLYVRAEKDGYYKTSGYPWDGPTRSRMAPSVNVYTVVLKRIVNPVAMIHRRVTLAMPVTNQPVAFDLEKGDWLSPYGKGERADMMITGTKRWKSTDDMEITVMIQFTNTLDGIQRFSSPSFVPLALESRLPSPQVAPEAGYEAQHPVRIGRAPGGLFETSLKDGVGHLIRVRTVVDKDGKIAAANYAWVAGEISIGGYHNRPISVKCAYYYNPDPHSRSLEPEEIAKQQTGP